MPEDVKAVAAALPYRDFMTVGLLVDKLKIKNETKLKTLGNIVPDCWIYIHDRSAKIGRMQIFNNWSPYMVKDPEHTVWIGLEYFCNEGDEMWAMSDEDFIRMATGGSRAHRHSGSGLSRARQHPHPREEGVSGLFRRVCADGQGARLALRH